jgi:biopolymer transport protein ExbB/TolQ
MMATLQQLLTPTGLVWVLLGLESITVVAVGLAALTGRLRYLRKRSLRRQLAAGQTFCDRLDEALPFLPQGPVGDFMRWRATHTVSPPAVEQKIALLLTEAEGSNSQVLDFVKVSSPLLGLGGTLLGLQTAFGQATPGQAAVQEGLAMALNTTLAGITVAFFALAALRFLVARGLEHLETALWEANLMLEAVDVRAAESAPVAVAPDQEEFPEVSVYPEDTYATSQAL